MEDQRDADGRHVQDMIGWGQGLDWDAGGLIREAWLLYSSLSVRCRGLLEDDSVSLHVLAENGG